MISIHVILRPDMACQSDPAVWLILGLYIAAEVQDAIYFICRRWRRYHRIRI